MKKLIVLLTLILVGFSSIVFAAQRTKTFTWVYALEEEVNIGGFRIYMNCGSADCIVLDNIPPTSRAATITFDDQGKPTSFTCQAFRQAPDGIEDKSDMSDTAVFVPPRVKPKPVGNFK